MGTLQRWKNAPTWFSENRYHENEKKVNWTVTRTRRVSKRWGEKNNKQAVISVHFSKKNSDFNKKQKNTGSSIADNLTHLGT